MVNRYLPLKYNISASPFRPFLIFSPRAIRLQACMVKSKILGRGRQIRHIAVDQDICESSREPRAGLAMKECVGCKSLQRWFIGKWGLATGASPIASQLTSLGQSTS